MTDINFLKMLCATLHSSILLYLLRDMNSKNTNKKQRISGFCHMRFSCQMRCLDATRCYRTRGFVAESLLREQKGCLHAYFLPGLSVITNLTWFSDK